MVPHTSWISFPRLFLDEISSLRCESPRPHNGLTLAHLVMVMYTSMHFNPHSDSVQRLLYVIWSEFHMMYKHTNSWKVWIILQMLYRHLWQNWKSKVPWTPYEDWWAILRSRRPHSGQGVEVSRWSLLASECVCSPSSWDEILPLKVVVSVWSLQRLSGLEVALTMKLEPCKGGHGGLASPPLWASSQGSNRAGAHPDLQPQHLGLIFLLFNSFLILCTSYRNLSRLRKEIATNILWYLLEKIGISGILSRK